MDKPYTSLVPYLSGGWGAWFLGCGAGHLCNILQERALKERLLDQTVRLEETSLQLVEVQKELDWNYEMIGPNLFFGALLLFYALYSRHPGKQDQNP